MAGLYLHFPFCLKKCAYCDFYSIEADDFLIRNFLVAVGREASFYRERFPSQGTTIETIYLGGGTPSMLHPDQMDSLLYHFAKTFPLSDELEITVETNPGTISPQSLLFYKEAGVNRISIGVQSFDCEELRLLGRIHTAEQAEDLIKGAKEAGFKDVGIDLIYGLPDQTLEPWKETLAKTIRLYPTHISTYNLTWSQSTELGRKIETGALTRPDDKIISDMYLLAHKMFSDAGFEHYEISNFALPGHRCRHNEGYWTGETYLGLGPSAHSFIGNLRFWNISDVRKYIDVLSHDRLPVADREILDRDQRNLERIVLGLRRREGIPVGVLKEKQNRIPPLVHGGLASVKEDFLSLTAKGFLLADEIALQFFN